MNKKIDETLRIARSFGDGRNRVFSGGTELIQHLPAVAPLAYLHSLFAPLAISEIGELDDSLGGVIPKSYQDFLQHMNGAIFFGGALSFFGAKSPLNKGLDHATQQPFDILPANSQELFRTILPGHCIVGGYNWDSSRVVMPTHGESVFRCDNTLYEVMNSWPNFQSFIFAEYNRLLALFDEVGLPLDESEPTTPV